jgi:hypothetical protein
MSAERSPAPRRASRGPKAEPRERRIVKPYAYRIEALRRAINYRKDYALRYARRLARLQEVESLGAIEACEGPVRDIALNRNKVSHPPPDRPPSGGRDPVASAYSTTDVSSSSNSHHAVPPARRGAVRWGVAQRSKSKLLISVRNAKHEEPG